MIKVERTVLDNGLRVLFHKDETTPLVSVNLLYDVGSKDENENQTGFAHLFEHLMFGGSAHIPAYDKIADQVGAETNAFTNNDFTNYYITLPKAQTKIAFWMESDRMQYLTISQNKLDVQKQVVIEEFKQSYLNRPYGDVWMLLRPLSYTRHPYQWCTIGKEISHIEQAKLKDVEDFFARFYAPNNAILSVVGDLEWEKVQSLAQEWFGDIPSKNIAKRNLPVEPLPTSARTKTVYRDVPSDAIYMTFPMCNRNHKDFYIYDLLSDILSNGKSSRLYIELCKNQEVCNEVNAFISGDIDDGLFVISAKIVEGQSVQKVESVILEELQKIITAPPKKEELQKVKNKIEVNLAFGQIKALDKAMSLGYFELLGNANKINTEYKAYEPISPEDIQRVASEMFQEKYRRTLYYLKGEEKD